MAGAALTSRACCLCGGRIADGEPFLTALVFAGEAIANRPFHLQCHVDAIANAVAARVGGEGNELAAAIAAALEE